MSANDPATQQAAAAVQDYVVRSKNWEESQFRVTFNRKEGTDLVFWVLHADDEASTTPGGGKSIEVYVDPAHNSVVKELAFQ